MPFTRISLRAGKGPDVFDQPTSVAIAPNGDIFVAEGHAPTFGNSRITKFDKNGKFIKSFGHVGSGEGEFKSPHVIAFDSTGRLFVAFFTRQIVSFNPQDGSMITMGVSSSVDQLAPFSPSTRNR